MTFLDVVFRYGGAPREPELRAINGMREVYGILQVAFSETDHTVRVRYDASRLQQDAVAKLLRTAGIDLQEKLTLV